MKPVVLSTDIAHQNSWYRVRHDALEWAPGKKGDFFVVEGYSHVIIIAEQDGELLVERLYRHTIGAETLEFPAGRIEEGEDVEAAARRELQEETGYAAETMTNIGYFYTANGIANLRGTAFIAQGLRRAEQATLEDGELGLKSWWMPIEEWNQKLRHNEITDACTLSAWSLYLASKSQPSL